MRTLGCAVSRVQDLGMAGASDPAVFQKAQENEAVLVTTDRGSGDVRTYSPSSHRGIIVLKVATEPEQIHAVHRTLQHLSETEESFEGALFVVDARKYRRRKEAVVDRWHSGESLKSTPRRTDLHCT